MTSEKIFESIEYVVENSSFVSINHEAIEKFSKDFVLSPSTHWSDIYPLGFKRLKSDDDLLDFLFLIGSQAFCFWGYPEKWKINYKSKELDGWWALIASFERAMEAGIPILEGEYLSKLSIDETRLIFNGEPEIPLLTERYQILKNIGEVLVKKHKGRFHNFYKSVNRDAFGLLREISGQFYGFDDVSSYQGRKVYFYKKIQVVISDIYSVFKGKGYGDIKNVDKLPGHADYKIPAILRKFGILIYDKKLSDKVDKRIEIKTGSDEEIEIRVNMLWAIQLMCNKLRFRYSDIDPTVLCGILWNLSQGKSLSDKPYHLSKTIYY